MREAHFKLLLTKLIPYHEIHWGHTEAYSGSSQIFIIESFRTIVNSYIGSFLCTLKTCFFKVYRKRTVNRAGEMDFKVREGEGGAWNTEKYCRPPWLVDKKNFRILDALEWLKQEYFDFGDSLLMVSALKPFLFYLCHPFFFLLRKK